MICSHQDFSLRSKRHYGYTIREATC